MLQFESRSPDSNIKTGGDALWWAMVTITTVGYGDFYPVTTLGRLTGVSVMFAGVGIIGALASILASILVPPPKPADPVVEAEAAATAERAVSAGSRVEREDPHRAHQLRAEVTSLRDPYPQTPPDAIAGTRKRAPGRAPVGARRRRRG